VILIINLLSGFLTLIIQVTRYDYETEVKEIKMPRKLGKPGKPRKIERPGKLRKPKSTTKKDGIHKNRFRIYN
jgi:hypothetical protein